MAKTVYIARHGESTWNAERRVQGQTDVPLSARGESQAAALGRWFRDTPLGAVFSSDLARARETAAAVVAAQRAAGRTAPPHHILPALRERDYGSWEGLTVAEVQAARERLHQEPAAVGLGASVSPPDAPPDAETFEAMERRLLGAWRELLSMVPAPEADGAVLVVSHGAAIRALMCGLTRTPYAEQSRWQLGNAALCTLHVSGGTEIGSAGGDGTAGGGVRVETWNDVSHLEPATTAE